MSYTEAVNISRIFVWKNSCILRLVDGNIHALTRLDLIEFTHNWRFLTLLTNMLLTRFLTARSSNFWVWVLSKQNWWQESAWNVFSFVTVGTTRIELQSNNELVNFILSNCPFCHIFSYTNWITSITDIFWFQVTTLAQKFQNFANYKKFDLIAHVYKPWGSTLKGIT